MGLVVFKGVAYLLDPLFHWIGLSALTAKPMEGLWTVLYNSTCLSHIEPDDPPV
jgi:hypothetical protein